MSAEPRSLRLVATLALAGLLSGLLLATTYELTLPAIEANRRAALRAAVFEVVPGTRAMRELVLDGDSVVYATYGDDGRLLGFAIPAAGAGFQDSIALLYGFDPVRRRVVGMRVLESRETPGLGDKIFKDAAFVAEFDDLAVEPAITVVKHGSAAHEVDGITGATISSKAVVRIINERNAALLSRLPAAAQVPPPPTAAEVPR